MPFLFSKINKDIQVVLILWAILTGININKAFHIDDTFHLKSAQWIAKHPLTPMSGMVNWYDVPEKFARHNQPPLLFYTISLVASITGYHEVPLHLLLSLFTFLALFYFQKLARYFYPDSSYLPLVFFAFCPALIHNQNLMTDIPILALALGFLFYLFQFTSHHNKKSLLKAALFCSASVLIKYSMLPLVPLGILHLALHGKFKLSYYLLLPFGFLLLWSGWNLLEYGGVHIKERPKNDITLSWIQEQGLAMISCLGSILPIGPYLIFSYFKQKSAIIVVTLTAILLIIFPIITYHEFIHLETANTILYGLFYLNGSIILFFILSLPLSKINTFKTFLKDDKLTLFLFISGMLLFILLFAPFTATRHILLVIPAILLILYKFLHGKTFSFQAISAIPIILLGIILSISDWVYADFYRDVPELVRQDFPKQKILSSGHWGWQWYSEQMGMETYNKDSIYEEGHLLAIPQNISRQNIHDTFHFEKLRQYTRSGLPYTFFSGLRFASMYNSYPDKASWEFGFQSIDTVLVGRLRYVKYRENE